VRWNLNVIFSSICMYMYIYIWITFESFDPRPFLKALTQGHFLSYNMLTWNASFQIKLSAYINLSINWCRHVQGCKVRLLVLPHLLCAIGVVKGDILLENAQVLSGYNWCRRVQGFKVRLLVLPHLLCAIGVVKGDILPENAHILSRYSLKTLSGY